MVKFTIYTGGYTTFIVSYLFDTQSASLTYLDTILTTPNCSWITPHLTNPNLIYRNGPAFCAPLTTGQVAFMNYASGNGEIIPTVNGGTKFDNSKTGLETFPPALGGVTGTRCLSPTWYVHTLQNGG
ncbi:hypothetical protein K438DRAFT_1841725 [Mycena galopus ATCC 62051]|nr:hypothetical protein K438DRAFT_1841725 [Mycena galopus ATCC 62051]